ncbi:MAG: hypothetical protein JWQ97_1945 [Phenylobacterium sp.]|nr:hypothetical protein [Phenylobacterium sp.]
MIGIAALAVLVFAFAGGAVGPSMRGHSVRGGMPASWRLARR